MILLNPRGTSAFSPSFQEVHHQRGQTLGDVGSGRSSHCVDLLLTVVLNERSLLCICFKFVDSHTCKQAQIPTDNVCRFIQ